METPYACDLGHILRVNMDNDNAFKLQRAEGMHATRVACRYKQEAGTIYLSFRMADVAPNWAPF